MPVSGMSFTSVRGTVPSVSTSGINQGYSAKKGDLVPVEFKVAQYSERSEVDIRLLESFPSEAGGQAFARQTQDDLIFEGILNGFEEDLIYADSASNVNDFNGLATYMPNINGTTVIDGGGATADSQTSIYFVKWGEQGVQGIFNVSSGASPSQRDLGEHLVVAPDGSGDKMVAMVSNFDWKAGIKVNPIGIGRLANIETSAHVTLDAISTISRYMKGGYDAIFTSPKGAAFLDILSGNNLTPMVLDTELKLQTQTFQGKPVFVSDSISETEAVLV